MGHYSLEDAPTTIAAQKHVVSAHTGTEFDFADNPAAADLSTSENQMVYRVAMIHRF